MSYTQGILVSVSSILNNRLMSKQTVGFFPTLHTTIQTIAIQTITVSEAIILKSKQTQGFFSTRRRNSFGFPLPQRQLVCRFNLKLIFLLLFYSLFVVEFIQANKSVVRVLFIIARETSLSLSILIADSLSGHLVFPPPFGLIAFSFEPAAFQQSQINQAINLILIKVEKCDNIRDVHQISQLSPLRHKGDQHEFSLNNISTPSTENAVRINKLITNGKMLSFCQIEFFQLIL